MTSSIPSRRPTPCAVDVLSPLSMGGTDHWLAVINDVTERKRLERGIIEIANREQQRIGSDLHDGLGHELTGIFHRLVTRLASARELAANTTSGAREFAGIGGLDFNGRRPTGAKILTGLQGRLGSIRQFGVSCGRAAIATLP